MASGPLNQSTNRERPVTASLPKNTPPHKAIPPPQSMRGARKAPHTPPIVRRRSAPSLHRAVVLRLAQRALERERYEEQQEEDEVEAVVSPERELGPLEFSDDESEDDDKEDLEELDRPAIPSVRGLLVSKTLWRGLKLQIYIFFRHRAQLLNRPEED